MKNLDELPPSSRPSKVLNFYRSPLRYAQNISDQHGTWVLRENTGLKGKAAEWARANLEEPVRMQGCKRVNLRDRISHDYSGFAQCTKARGHHMQCSKGMLLTLPPPRSGQMIYAYGFERNRLPQLSYEGKPVSDDHIFHDSRTGQLQVASMEGSTTAEPLPHLYG